ncbi:hypothetical protein GPECTOR_10g1001 [Gonium pectorale]|uniref:Centromere protein J C-terminal domain-containing protein n=1 Tax=Gonium pectorale TaxID=33097 RepID=A0A150GQ78_GONPE|nr:hypothetical protein GPECTOR_10g1001 [Gonium pectorale]|eukprot:KXZ51979.1 hypothetical protein GPECTOR_10g1001 [Gonium pectorale]
MPRVCQASLPASNPRHLQVALADGSSRVYFNNGDIKWTVPPETAPGMVDHSSDRGGPLGIGVVHYFYAEVGTWHSTYGGEGGVEVFYFPDGQTEAHHPGWGKEIMYPDGLMRVVTTDGEEVEVTQEMLSWAIQQPKPRVDGLDDDAL